MIDDFTIIVVPSRFVTPVYVNTLYATVRQAATCEFYLILDKTPMPWGHIREVTILY